MYLHSWHPLYLNAVHPNTCCLRETDEKGRTKTVSTTQIFVSSDISF